MLMMRKQCYTDVGVEHVISVTGYFCKLCHKFYNNESMARITHCKSEAHFNKYLVCLHVSVAHICNIHTLRSVPRLTQPSSASGVVKRVSALRLSNNNGDGGCRS